MEARAVGIVADEITTRRRSAFALALALVALSTLDLVVTEMGVRHLGAVELNPLVAPMLGTPWALLAKIGLPALILVLATRIRTRFVFGMLRALVAIYLAVAIINMGQFLLVVS